MRTKYFIVLNFLFFGTFLFGIPERVLLKQAFEYVTAGDLDGLKGCVESDPLMVNERYPDPDNGEALLHAVVRSSHHDQDNAVLACFLLQYGAYPDVPFGSLRMTPLHMAAENGEQWVVQEFIEANALRNLVSYNREHLRMSPIRTPLDFAQAPAIKAMLLLRGEKHFIDLTLDEIKCALFYGF